jgi:hypothetical protein
MCKPHQTATHRTEAIMETATRDGRGRFLPGQSGNPAGKKPGTQNHATRLLQWLADTEEAQAMRALIAQAIKGNVAALRILLDRIDPKPRGPAITLALPDAASVADKFDAAFAHMAAGEITPEEALMVARFLDQRKKAITADDAAAPVDHAPTGTPALVTEPPPAPPQPRGEDLHSASILQESAAVAAPAPAFTRRRAAARQRAPTS